MDQYERLIGTPRKPQARYIARCSGGNDSIAMLQLMREHQLKDVTVVYSDTEWADEDWVPRVAQLEDWVIGFGWKYVCLKSEGFEQMVMNQTATGMFPTRIRKFCTKYLKILPFLKWVATFDPNKRALICVGVRRAESEARKSAPAFMPEQDDGRHVWHPLVEFDDEARDAMILKTPFPVLPHQSKECFCINWGRKDLRMAKEDHVAWVEKLEAAVGRPMFDPAGKMGATGIREVMRWAHSEPGKFVAQGSVALIGEAMDDDLGETCADSYCGS